MSRNPYTDLSQDKDSLNSDKYLSNTQSTGSSGYAPYSTTGTSGLDSTYPAASSYDSAPVGGSHPIADEFRTAQPATAYSGDTTQYQGGYSASDKYVSSGAADQNYTPPSYLGEDTTTNNPYSSTKDQTKDAAYDTYNQTADKATSAKDQTKDAAYSTYDTAADKTAYAKDQTLSTANDAYNTTADNAAYAKDRTLDTANDAYNKTADTAVSAKESVKDSANNAYNTAADATPSTQQVKDKAAGVTGSIRDTASSGIASVQNMINSAYNAAANTASNIVENSRQTAAQGVDTVKQTAAQGADTVKQNHEFIAQNSRTTPTTSSESSGGMLPLDKILELNNPAAHAAAMKPAEPAPPPAPKMVYAMASDDGSVKVLGEVPEGMSKEDMDTAAGNQTSGAQNDYQFAK